MSSFGLSVFKLPSAYIGRQRFMTSFEIPVEPVLYVQHMPVNKYVGCIIITNSLSGYGYDVVLPKLSGQNLYGVFSGRVGGPYSDYDCTQTLMRSINLHIDHSTPFIEFNDNGTDIPYKIYVKYMTRLDLQRMNYSLQSSIASNDFEYFSRFPLNVVSYHHNFNSLNDDAGVTRFLNSSASTSVRRIVQNIHRFV